ncbi:MAG: phage portal protein [Gemmatimonadetes bacterium]|nr:phage portal protein [Gemmatimonadota bacterium]
MRLTKPSTWFKRAPKVPDYLPQPIGSRGRSNVTGYGSGQLSAILRGSLPGSTRAWVREAGDLSLNSIVAISLQWYARNWPQGRWELRIPTKDGQYSVIDSRGAVDLLSMPQPGIPGSVWWAMEIESYFLHGTAYARKVRAGGYGAPIGLQYLPSDMVMPDGVNYLYTVDGQTYPIPREDMVVVRIGRDPYDHRLGRAPLLSCLREIAADNAGSTMAYAMAKNNAVPSLIISPDMSAGDVELDPDVAKTMKKRVAEDFSGDAAGGVAVLTDSFKIDKVSFSPDEMALDQMRVKPEERITAVLGLNCMVLGLGAGLAHNTYSNYEEARQAAWEDGMLPLQCSFAEAYTEALRLDFGFPEGAYLAFDNSQVRALADDVSADGTRAAALYQSGVVDRATAKRIAGESPDPADVGVYHPKADPDAQTPEPVGGPVGRSPFEP